MWHAFPLSVFPIIEDGNFILPAAQASLTSEWHIFFLLLLQPSQSEDTFISTFKICLQPNYFLPLPQKLAAIFLICATISFCQDCCRSFLGSGFCPAPRESLVCTSTRGALLKRARLHVTFLLKALCRLSTSLLQSQRQNPHDGLQEHTPLWNHLLLTFTKSVSSAKDTLFSNFRMIHSISSKLFLPKCHFLSKVCHGLPVEHCSPFLHQGSFSPSPWVLFFCFTVTLYHTISYTHLLYLLSISLPVQ